MKRHTPTTPRKANRIFLLCVTLAAILVTAVSLAQDLRFNDKEYFTASIILDPNASIKEHGLFIGGEIEYVGLIYTRVGVANFAALEDGLPNKFTDEVEYWEIVKKELLSL